jgi:hypothetical protein
LINQVTTQKIHRPFIALQYRKNNISTAAGWIIIALLLIQFIPLDRAAHPSKSPQAIPGSVVAVLKTHCFDCHSDETRWPRTAYIAPLSWYVTGKVRDARNALNFSNFDALPKPARIRLEKSVSGIAGSVNLSSHATIPGFPPLVITDKERQGLIGWAVNNNRESDRTIHNSSQR